MTSSTCMTKCHVSTAFWFSIIDSLYILLGIIPKHTDNITLKKLYHDI